MSDPEPFDPDTTVGSTYGGGEDPFKMDGGRRRRRRTRRGKTGRRKGNIRKKQSQRKQSRRSRRRH